MSKAMISAEEANGTTVKDLKSVLNEFPDDATAKIEGVIRVRVNEDDIVSEEYSDNQNHELSKKPYDTIVNDMINFYNNIPQVHDLKYDPIVTDINDNIVLDNYDNELMFENNSPAIASTAHIIRKNNDTIAKTLAAYDYAKYRQLLEYNTQAMYNIADAAIFDSEMKTLCRIVNKDDE